MAAKLEWGAKRTCLSCGARFYDMRRDPITCPKCSTVFDPEAVFRPRRARSTESPVANKAPPKKKETVSKAAVVAEDEEDLTAGELLEDDSVAGEGDEDDDLIEDTSDLGEDEDDLPPVPGQDDEEDT